jgi:hypothetical protein
MTALTKSTDASPGGWLCGKPAPHKSLEGFIGSIIAFLPAAENYSLAEKPDHQRALALTGITAVVYINRRGEVQEGGIPGEPDDTDKH